MGTNVHNDDINSLYMLDFRDYIDDGGGEDMTNRDEGQYVYMKLTVLADNNTYIDKYYLGEPALSFYIVLRFPLHRYNIHRVYALN